MISIQQRGISLVETIVFLVVVSIGLVSLLSVFSQNIVQSVDPVVRVTAMEKAQALLDEILARKFDENTPTGGIPACDSTGAPACLGIVPDADFDDVGDYHNFTDNSDPNYSLSVTVVNGGSELGLSNNAQARLITISVLMPTADTLAISAFRANF